MLYEISYFAPVAPGLFLWLKKHRLKLFLGLKKIHPKCMNAMEVGSYANQA